MVHNMLYIVIHTKDQPTGELRGDSFVGMDESTKRRIKKSRELKGSTGYRPASDSYPVKTIYQFTVTWAKCAQVTNT
jgi:hypothetical protein